MFSSCLWICFPSSCRLQQKPKQVWNRSEPSLKPVGNREKDQLNNVSIVLIAALEGFFSCFGRCSAHRLWNGCEKGVKGKRWGVDGWMPSTWCFLVCEMCFKPVSNVFQTCIKPLVAGLLNLGKGNREWNKMRKTQNKKGLERENNRNYFNRIRNKKQWFILFIYCNFLMSKSCQVSLYVLFQTNWNWHC